MPKISESWHMEGLSIRYIIGQRPAAAIALVLLLATLLAAGCGRSTTQAQTSGTHTAATPMAIPITATPTLPPVLLTCATGPTVPVTLTPAPSLSPAEILAGMEATPGFVNPAQAAFAPSGSTYSYDPPVLVLPATVGDTDGNGYYSLPHYIIQAAVNAVHTIIIYDVHYNPTTRVFSPDSFGPMRPGDPNYGKPFPWVGVSSGAAIAALCSAKGLALAASTVPELVFFWPWSADYQYEITHTQYLDRWRV